MWKSDIKIWVSIWIISFISFKDKQMNFNNTIIKTKPTFEEVINEINNLLRDDISNTMKEVINIVMKEWIWMQFNLIYNSIRLQMNLNEFFLFHFILIIFTIFNKMPRRWIKTTENKKPKEKWYDFLHRNKFNIKNSFVTTWNIWHMFYI